MLLLPEQRTLSTFTKGTGIDVDTYRYVPVVTRSHVILTA
jgi:hypothetical protein